MNAGAAGQAAGPPARPAPTGPGPARPPRSARTGPGRCRRHRGSATPPAARHRGPSRPAAPSCRIPPERTPAPGPEPAPRPAPPPGAGGARTPAAARAHATSWPTGHPARPWQPRLGPQRAAQPSAAHPSARPATASAAAGVISVTACSPLPWVPAAQAFCETRPVPARYRYHRPHRPPGPLVRRCHLAGRRRFHPGDLGHRHDHLLRDGDLRQLRVTLGTEMLLLVRVAHGGPSPSGVLGRSPVAYHPAGFGSGTATLKFYEGRDILQLSQLNALFSGCP